MKIREGRLIAVAAVTAMALLVPASARAGDKVPKQPDPSPAPPTAPQDPQAPGQTTSLDLTLRGAKNDKVRVGKHARLLGTLRPWQPGQQVAVTVLRGDRTVKKKVVSVSRGEGDAGHFEFRGPVLVKPGHYEAIAQLAGGGATADSSGVASRPPDRTSVKLRRT